jgi:hypothetical protein
MEFNPNFAYSYMNIFSLLLVSLFLIWSSNMQAYPATFIKNAIVAFLSFASAFYQCPMFENCMLMLGLP